MSKRSVLANCRVKGFESPTQISKRFLKLTKDVSYIVTFSFLYLPASPVYRCGFGFTQHSIRQLGKGLDDASDRIVFTHVVNVHPTKVDSLIKIADDHHVLVLAKTRVFEALLEHIILGLLDRALCRLLSVCGLKLKKETFASTSEIALLELLIGLFFTAAHVSLSDVGGKATFNLFKLERLFIFLAADLLFVNTLLCALLNLAVLRELLDLTLGNFEIIDELSLRSGQNLVNLSLPLLQIFLKLVEIDDVADGHALKFSLLVVLLPKLALHIFEETARADLDIGDLNSGEMDAPAGDNRGHLFHDCITQGLPVLEDVVDS